MTVERVVDHRSEQEFTLTTGEYRGVAAYQLEGDTIVFTHTIVPPEIEGRGIGTRLIRGALDLTRDRDLKVVAQCPFVRAFIDRHPEMRDLLA